MSVIETHIKPAALAPVANAHLHAFNNAFVELGLDWHWDHPTYHWLLRTTGNDDLPLAYLEGVSAQALRHAELVLIGAYLDGHQPHLLRAYEPEFLCDLIHCTKVRCFEAANEGRSMQPPRSVLA
ncbi:MULTISPECIES: hypothetical protein [Pandoraea]|uniref:LysR family transcriptional regulator n=1 Tax=Pandoraea norimbergensis TaxID=93219 RepID=A0ABM5WQP3_9BURK|nr:MULTISPECIES: hypothetical protein [Pandoraea]ALS62774.1 hypothetical protein AT302_26185 [Pandoraea norimbergensis]